MKEQIEKLNKDLSSYVRRLSYLELKYRTEKGEKYIDFIDTNELQEINLIKHAIFNIERELYDKKSRLSEEA